MNRKFALNALFILVMFLSASFSLQTFAQVTSGVVINEVYTGGGTTGATYNRDFVELYCNSLSACDLNGLSVQFLNQSLGTVVRIITFGSGTTIPSGGYYLIAAGPDPVVGTTPGASLPTVDATAANKGNLATSDGNVFLLNQTTVLTTGSCPTSNILDQVAYGTGTCREGLASAPSGTATLSVQRFPNGVDTNQNGVDFKAYAPSPGTVNLAPSAALASIEGFVRNSSGKSIHKALVTLTDSQGNTQTVISDWYGRYRFTNINVGETYVLSISYRNLQFQESTRVITVTEDMNGVDFVTD